MKKFIALLLTLAMTFTLSTLAGCKKDKEQTAGGDGSITESSQEEASSKGIASQEESQKETSSQQPSVSVASSLAQAIGQDRVDYLMTLPTSYMGWGPGTNFDADNRSTACTGYQTRYGEKYAVEYIKENEKNMYLTFDEGYEYNNNTAKILDVLKEKQVKAVFFITLDYAESRPDLVRRMIDEGHIVGNHTADHPDCTKISLEAAYEDIMELHTYVKDNFGYEMNLFRFPSGSHNERLLAMVKEIGYKTLFWSFAYVDWETANQPDEAAALQKLTDRIHPGGLYLLHAVSNTNTNILADFIDKIREQGYAMPDYR